MAYSALVRRLLISSPGDVPLTDLAIVQKAVNRWNGIYGESFGTAVLPTSWGTHAAAEFGRPPQDILNQQLVDRSDICLALLANRLGTPTAAAESGTAEEIERIASAGKYVAILRSRRPVDASRIDLEQAQALERYLAKIRSNALILDYSSDDELSQNVDTILAAAVARDQGRAELQLQEQSSQPAERVAEVWPRVDSSEEVVNFGGTGRTMTRRNWSLVLANTGNAPAHSVRVKFEPYTEGENVWEILTDNPESDPEIEILAPQSEIRFVLIATMGMAIQVRCTVTWKDDRGDRQNAATLRLA
jgi:hypothetical protein